MDRPSLRIVLQGRAMEHLRKTRLNPDAKLEQAKTAKPTDEQWTAFKACALEARVAEWKSAYDTTDIGGPSLDGTWWTLRASWPGVSVSSKGHNAYPDRQDPSQTSLSRGPYATLLQGLRALFKYSEHDL